MKANNKNKTKSKIRVRTRTRKRANKIYRSWPWYEWWQFTNKRTNKQKRKTESNKIKINETEHYNNIIESKQQKRSKQQNKSKNKKSQEPDRVSSSRFWPYTSDYSKTKFTNKTTKKKNTIKQ